MHDDENQLMVPTLPNTIWRILEYVGVCMRGFPLYFHPEHYHLQFPRAEKGLNNEELKRAYLVPKPRMPKKIDITVDLMPTRHTHQVLAAPSRRPQ